MVSPARDVEQAVARGSELLKKGNLADAQKVFRAALALDEGNAKVLALLGLTHFRSGQFEEARPIYEQLVERAPTDASHRLNLGLVYLKLGDADHAIGALEASRALDPSQGRAVSYLGLAYARAGRYAEAYRAFLLAGQNELASEIETNLTPAERDGIHAQLQRPGIEPRTRPAEVPSPSALAAMPPAAHSVHDAITEPVRVVRPTPPPPPRTVTPRAVPPPPPPPPELARAAEADAADDDPSASSSMEMFIERSVEHTPAPPPAAVVEPSRDVEEPRMSDSLQFVLPQREAVPRPPEGRSMISQAVDVASPATAVATAVAARVAAGSAPPLALSQLATDELVRPEDGDHPFEVSASGALIVRVSDRVLTRLAGVHVTGGDLAYKPAVRRSRGHLTEEPFDYGGERLHVVSGRGYLIALPGDQTFTSVTLDDDIFYLREDLVFAFQAQLRWENGNIPGLRGRFPVVQFRGDGAVALRTAKPLVRVKLPAAGLLFVDATRLAGWIGRVIPRAVVPPEGGPMGEVCVECTGEGVLLIDPVGDLAASGLRLPASAEAPVSRARPSQPPPPPPAPPPAPAESSAETSLADDLRDEF